ncbi:MAG: tRNA (guanine(10)-N(2))-dimethyltransferase [Euryarchaeota archaeon]|nr:tRNA (guanine(10)-N(2))-dimethyltransferase [Euryarchaeota archaeon]
MFAEIVEGRTKLLVPERSLVSPREIKKALPPVFFNPRMKLNRDVTCALVRALIAAGEEVKFLDLLAASGAKGLRVAREAKARVHLNDGSESAVELIRKNAALNNLEVGVSQREANLFLLESRGSFNFIDIDPFGTPVPFLHNAILALPPRRGYLAVTATDTAPLCGVYPRACFRKYFSIPLRGELCKEVGLRILLATLAREAAKLRRGMRVLLAHATDHYFRAIVVLRSGRRRADEALAKLGYLYYCRACGRREFEASPLPSGRSCACGESYEIAGPLWLGELKDEELAERAAEEAAYLQDNRCSKLLATIAAELEVPFFYDVHHLARRLSLHELPPMRKILEELHRRGYSATRTHISDTGIKTDAPLEALQEAVKGPVKS